MIDQQQQRALAYLAARMRPTGASPWDEPGIVAALAKVQHLALPDVAMATIRAAANADAKTPGVIPNLAGEHWRERVTRSEVFRPPHRGEHCHLCGKWREACVCSDGPTLRPDAPSPNVDDHIQRLRELVRGPIEEDA